MGSTSRNQKPGGKVLHDSLQRSVSGNIYLPGRVVKHFFAAKAVVGGSPATRTAVRPLAGAARGASAKKNEPAGGFFLTHPDDFDISQSNFDVSAPSEVMTDVA